MNGVPPPTLYPVLFIHLWAVFAGCLGKQQSREPQRDTVRFANNNTFKLWFVWRNNLAPVKTCTVSAFFLSVSFFFTCQSDFDAGPVPPSPRIRHHSGKKRSLKLPRWSPLQKHRFSTQWERETLTFKNMRFVFVFHTGKNVLFHRKVLCSFEIQQHGRAFSGRLKHVLTSCP